jgi:hypothetical protein
MYNIFSQSNFYSAVHNVFSDQVLFGIGPMFVNTDPVNGINCKTWTVGEYVMIGDDKGMVGTAYRHFWMPVKAVANWFGEERLSETAKSLLKTKPEEFIFIVHCIYQRKDFDPTKKDNLNMPYGSVYWEDRASRGNQSSPNEDFLAESGYRTNPLMAPRWDVVAEEVYGSSCPGMESLPDVKMLQKLTRDSLLAIDKVVNPPMNIPAKFHGRLSLLPGAQNYVSTQENEGIKPTYQIQPDIGAVESKIAQVKDQISRGFFNDLFLMLVQDNKTMTATEVAQRHEDKLAILGPVIERQNSELLSPLIDRVFDIGMNDQLFLPPPKELEGMDIKVDYISLLAQAQKMVGTQALEKQAMFVGNLAQFKPEVLDTIDFDEMSSQYGELVGTPPKIVKDQKLVDAERAQRAQQQQAAQAQEAMGNMATAAKDLGSVKTDEENVASNILGQMVDQ